MSPIIRTRVANACDTCKQRKVKCDGNSPCSYCKSRRGGLTCHFSPSRRRARARHLPSPRASNTRLSVPSSARSEASPNVAASRLCSAECPSASADDLVRGGGHVSAEEEQEADVPREARLLCDARVFIGDCAPLSLFQTVRQIVTSRVDSNAFAPQTSRVSILENSTSIPLMSIASEEPHVNPTSTKRLVSVFISVTSGLVHLFDNARLSNHISAWAIHKEVPKDTTSAVNYLVVAIGSQSVDQETAADYFQYGKALALSSLGGDLGIETVQAFALITLYMLRACQINGSFLFFGIAARAAYSIGLHRTEVNSRFGAEAHAQRDRLWKSLRVLDLFLSISMGRPPGLDKVDCTVPYRSLDAQGQETFDLLNASVQILSITEEIVLQVYSRRKISLPLTEGISRQLRDWSGRWLSRLKQTLTKPDREGGAEVIGACQAMSSYYYAAMLVARPFLMYELCKRLPDSTAAGYMPGGGDDNSGRAKLANACIDAACLMAESVLDLVNRRLLDGRMPLIVSWLFASSLVLGVGLLGGFGRILEKYARMSIAALEYFARHDTHAMQYSLIAKSLLSSASKYLERRDIDQRHRIAEASSHIFGLIPEERPSLGNVVPAEANDPRTEASNSSEASVLESSLGNELVASAFHDIDPALLSLGCSLDSASDPSFSGRNQQDQTDHVFGALNLFPLLDGNGHIDLAHYL
ncbi:hypothetical protein GGR52DRAFT_590839 [Hypoxylon sp. FL1284]|nr:hypothetical protein GGR52DRAFT_590839 [Hypoxylon sp. FL1284]